jgi:mono/diheme cytochrome c family protein
MGTRPIGRPISVGLCAATFLMAAIGCALAQDADKGRTEFMENCAGCHGADAKGAGPLSAKLKTKPADLTLLAKRNHGLLPPFTK